jgi:hypothetical protein
MENVIDVYTRPADPAHPVVCMDEMPKQLIGECREAYTDGHGVRHFDTEYVRNGTTNIFMAVDPLAGRRMAKVSARKTKQDFAYFVEDIAGMYPDAERITLVCDNLNTHDFGSLYETFAPDKAHALMQRFELVHTPKHGSWLNIAEIELSVLGKQCLNRRIATEEEMKRHVLAWETDRNERREKVVWRFQTADARIKLKHLYPEFA